MRQLMAAGAMLTTDIDAVRAFDLKAKEAGVRACGWRALKRADHSNCFPKRDGTQCRNCTATQYNADREAPLVAAVKQLCHPDLRAQLLG